MEFFILLATYSEDRGRWEVIVNYFHYELCNVKCIYIVLKD